MKTIPRLNLIVLRVTDIERSATFYRLLGFQFLRHSHGSGPKHYALEVDGLVFELYPATSTAGVTSSTRIGFAVEDVDKASALLAAFHGATLVAPPKVTEWGRRAVVDDPDGHRIELTEAATAIM